jgi:SAM-dependent methyltransferase
MTHPDAERWDARYREEPRFGSFLAARPFLVDHADWLPPPGLALDLAAGLGGNSGFLLGRGWRVAAFDISREGLRRARASHPGLAVAQVDLSRACLPPESVDALLNFFFLERSLWPSMAAALRPGGVLVFETMTVAMLEIKPHLPRVQLLEPGELAAAFPTLATLAYREGWSENDAGFRRATAALLARRPAAG